MATNAEVTNLEGVGYIPRTSTNNFNDKYWIEREENMVTPKRKSCTLPLSCDPVKVKYLDNKKPVEKVIGKTITKAAIWGLTSTIYKSINCFCKIKLYVTKYKTISNNVLSPPKIKYRKESAGNILLKGR